MKYKKNNLELIVLLLFTTLCLSCATVPKKNSETLSHQLLLTEVGQCAVKKYYQDAEGNWEMRWTVVKKCKNCPDE